MSKEIRENQQMTKRLQISVSFFLYILLSIGFADDL